MVQSARAAGGRYQIWQVRLAREAAEGLWACGENGAGGCSGFWVGRGLLLGKQVEGMLFSIPWLFTCEVLSFPLLFPTLQLATASARLSWLKR